MRDGFRIVDIDTHVNPSYDTLVNYLDPAARSRVDEFQPFVRTRSSNGTTSRVLHVAPYPFDRFPGEAPKEAKVVAGGKGALEGRVTRSSSHHRVPPAEGVQDENVHNRIRDMDAEGRDIDFLIPGTWATAASGLPDVTLTEALYRSYHNYIAAYCQPYLSRLKSMILVPGGDVEWAVKEVNRLKNEPWVAAFEVRALGALANAPRANCHLFGLASRGIAMKPAAFDYQAPGSLREAIDLLVSDPGAVVIAGGQSLMPVLAFRLATPSLLVDLRRLPGLGHIAVGDDGVRLGALVRWRDIEDERRLPAAHPLLHAAVAHVAHYQVRNRGTVGGSLAHGDPAAQLPGVAVTCEAGITLVGLAGSRTLGSGDFFTGPLSTLRLPDEIITELHLPKWPSGRRWAFRQYARREGDFALAGILLFYDEDRQGVVSNAHVGVIGACPRPHRLTRVETLLNGHTIDDGLIRQAAATAAEDVDPPDDLHGDAAYRRGLVATLIERGLRAAAEQASA